MEIFTALTINGCRHEDLNDRKVILSHTIRSLRVINVNFHPEFFKSDRFVRLRLGISFSNIAYEDHENDDESRRSK